MSLFLVIPYFIKIGNCIIYFHLMEWVVGDSYDSLASSERVLDALVEGERYYHIYVHLWAS